MPVVGIIIHYVLINAIEVQFLFGCADDGLRDHLSIAEKGFNVLVLVLAEIQLVLVRQQSAGRSKGGGFEL